MNGKQLKNSILQWAIQGKLVPQDPNDEPASVLLERIREEKAKLVKEKKIKKDKNESIIYRGDDNSYYEKFVATEEVKCIDEEIPFEIPEGWEWCRFSSIYKTLTDGTHSTPHYTETGVPFLSVKDMSNGSLNFNNTKFITESEHLELSKRCHPQKGDLLLSKVGTTGIPLIIDSDKEFSIFVSLALIKFTSVSVDKRFLIHLINSPLVQNQVQENTRGVGNKNWVLTAIANTLMLLPPLNEQLRITDKIDELTPIISKYSISQQRLEKLNDAIFDKLKKSILQEAIQGILVPQIEDEGTAQELLTQIRQEKQKLVKEGKLKKSALIDSVIFRGDDNKYYENDSKRILCIDDEIPFNIPDNWAWMRLGCCIKLLSGRDLDPYQYNANHQGIPYITGASNFFDGNILVNRWTENPITIAPQGALLITCKGTIGAMAFNNIGNIHIARQVMAIESYEVNLLYIRYYLQSGLNDIEKKAKSMIPGISRETVTDILFPMPPLLEQERIVYRINQLLQLIK
ncbi:type I restriction enzyme S subunit [Parabacteroides sp. PFB2-12]|uniref:restriction endonuclease subunit S n=1 Tax=unclassified Parabacteroides TaxID=2649774 RepID=UPI002473B9E1|nr:MULTISPECIES: restriction endonuclease subunit S [unclassified Parabacteroides]MDH6342474.1 type I restriction enzyme S subunit [Parabacteroides sp. PM6-13]MDH6390126.1 type I restriction enzyme S subunit [Parabacteroides sp. PFB2-12]